MKQFLLLILVLPFSIFSQNQWYPVDSINGPAKCLTTSFVIGMDAFVVGGIDDVDCTRKMYSYNPIQDDWDDELSWGGELGNGQNRAGAISFVLNEKAYVGLGQGNVVPYYNDMWTYDPVAQTWTQMADYTGAPRTGAVSFINNGKAYVGTGQGFDGLLNDFYSFNPTSNTWSAIANFVGTPRKFACAATMGTSSFVGCGEDGTDRNDFYQYLPLTDTWTPIAPMPDLGRSGAVCWGVFPQLYVALGENPSGQYLNDVWEYNAFGNVWNARTSFPGDARKFATAFVINDRAYVGTGASNTAFYDDFYMFLATLDLKESNEIIVEIFPNPVSDNLTVKTESDLIEVRIYDESGNEISKNSDLNQDVSHLASGTYFLAISTTKGIGFKKFIKL